MALYGVADGVIGMALVGFTHTVTLARASEATHARQRTGSVGGVGGFGRFCNGFEPLGA